MTRIQITVVPASSKDPPIELDAPDLATALAVADINVVEGSAQLFEDGRQLATVTRYGGDHAAFWKVK